MRFKRLAIATAFVGGAAMGHGVEGDASADQLALSRDLNGHALHVWAWLSNAHGLTNPANRNVDTTYCP